MLLVGMTRSIFRMKGLPARPTKEASKSFVENKGDGVQGLMGDKIFLVRTQDNARCTSKINQTEAKNNQRHTV